MRIFLTGINGFIGKTLRKKFSKDDKILCLTRKIDKAVNIPNLTQIEGDISSPLKWKDVVLDFHADCCIHLAWSGIPDFSLYKCRENIYQNLIFLEFLREAKIKNIIVAGSCAEYGECEGLIKESFEPNNPSIFGLSKLAVLSFLKRICFEEDFNFKWLRIFYVYGPHQRQKSLIPSIKSEIKNRTNNIENPYAAKDFIYVEDVVNAILKLTNNDIQSGIYNLGTGNLISVGFIANYIYSYYGLSIPYPNIHKPIKGFYADNSKLKSINNFDLKYNIELGLNETLNFFDN